MATRKKRTAAVKKTAGSTNADAACLHCGKPLAGHTDDGHCIADLNGQQVPVSTNFLLEEHRVAQLGDLGTMHPPGVARTKPTE